MPEQQEPTRHQESPSGLEQVARRFARGKQGSAPEGLGGSADPDRADSGEAGVDGRGGSGAQIDVMASIGGARGIVESIVPALLFVVVFTFTHNLVLGLALAIAAAAIATVVRLIQRQPFMQAIGSLVGVAVCAVVALKTKNAGNYFLPGFFMTGGTIVVLWVSAAVRWPLLGVAFGLIREQGTSWRAVPAQLRAYTLATVVFGLILALRLVVQVPLYLAGNVSALGFTRLGMGVPLYALGLWIAWLMTRGAAAKRD